MKALEGLTAEIREKLPRLKHIEKGQILRSLIEDRSCIIDVGEIFTIGHGDCTLFSDDSIEIGGYVYDIGNDFEIVGKEPMLNDVMEWLFYADEIGLRIDCYGNIGDHVSDSAGNYINPFVTWDLSKPFLKDQSPEIITFLHGLINHFNVFNLPKGEYINKATLTNK